MEVVDWLLEADPSIRWQTLRDLTDASPAAVTAERARVSREGLGADLLRRQAEDGAWHTARAPEWLSTLLAMQLLRATGIDPAEPAVQSAVARLEAGYRWADDLGGKPFSEGETEPCINGNALAASAYFGRASQSLAGRLLSEQLDDGGWNCEAPRSSRSSFHSTICVLEGLLEYERTAGPSDDIASARRRGEEYLLERALFRRRSTGEVASPAFLELAWPPRYHHDILRGLDYFRAAAVTPDPRVADAIRVLESKRQPDGRWLLEQSYAEPLDLELGETVGKPSRWLTLRALRVLRWYRA